MGRNRPAAPVVGSHFGVPPQRPPQAPEPAPHQVPPQHNVPPAAHHPPPAPRQQAPLPEYTAERIAQPEPTRPASAAQPEPTRPAQPGRRAAASARDAPAPAPTRPPAGRPRGKVTKAERRASRIRARDLAPGKNRAAGKNGKKKHSVGSTLMSLGALLFAAALIVGLSVPANAFIGGTPAAAVLAKPDVARLQTVVVSGDADPTTISHDSYNVVDYATRTRSEYGHLGTFTPTTGSIRWPFPYSVPISDGWGPRVAPCSGCSTFHQGVDFTPGVGTPIYAIADGIVEQHADDTYGLGNHVVIQHAIPGQNVESVYAHMITGSSTLKAGDPIKVGDFIGLVGDTGSSVGAHLHFEIHIDKVPVDPYAWLVQNTTNTP